jgi:septal ring factor EnvC (AmiA/AmiB activator)
MPMDEKLRKDIEAHVAAIFSEKEEAEMRKKTEEALEKAAATIEDLTNSLEEKNAEAEELESKVSESGNKIVELKAELEAAKQEAEATKVKLSEKEAALEEIKKDRAADVRMAELATAGVAQRNEESKVAQIAKVREMSDENFAAYKNELVSIRQAILEEIAAATKEEAVEETELEEKAEVKVETEEKTEVSEEGTVEKTEEPIEEKEDTSEVDLTPPASIDHGQAVFAALNMEHRPTKDIIEKYAELGKAMAEEFTRSRK